MTESRWRRVSWATVYARPAARYTIEARATLGFTVVAVVDFVL